MAIDFRSKLKRRSGDSPTDHSIAAVSPEVGGWLAQAKANAQACGDPEILIDLSSVARIASEELSELIRWQLSVKQCQQRLVLCNVQESVHQVLILTRLDRLIEFRTEPGHREVPSHHLPK